MKRLRQFLSSMTGRLFVILLLGMGIAAAAATVLANARRTQEFDRQLLVRTADRLQAYVQLLDANPEIRQRLLEVGAGLRLAPDKVRVHRVDQAMQTLLAQRSGPLAQARVELASFGTCQPELRQLLPRPPRPPEDVRSARERQRSHPSHRDYQPPRCRLISLTLSDGTPLRLAAETPAVARDQVPVLDPWFMSLLMLAIAVLAYVVARIASAPLQRLASAAAALGRDLDREPMAETGPREVRHAAQAFNAMQRQLQHHLAQRTQMLAAITHDLQTPLTRLRLRLENVADEPLRERLVADLAAMQALIREGLELARSEHSREQPMPLELDSLLESLVEDACEAGAEAYFDGGCGQVRVLRPMAMHRLFSNLLDNALKYGGRARIRAQQTRDGLSVHIHDNGPGIAEQDLATVFDPFVRLETSRSRDTGGAGLGLAIAKALAERDGAQLQLRNHPAGGLEAIVWWPAAEL